MNHCQYRQEIARSLVQALRDKLSVEKSKTKSIVRKIRPYDFSISIISMINANLKKYNLKEIKKPQTNIVTHLEDETNTNRGPQTRFWCGNCKVPVCILKCYDKHREVSKLKKFRLNDE